jgi:hypothetical protein
MLKGKDAKALKGLLPKKTPKPKGPAVPKAGGLLGKLKGAKPPA